eukprot:scaffold230780_cov50-Attheya_sp.AAC.1
MKLFVSPRRTKYVTKSKASTTSVPDSNPFDSLRHAYVTLDRIGGGTPKRFCEGKRNGKAAYITVGY